MFETIEKGLEALKKQQLCSITPQNLAEPYIELYGTKLKSNTTNGSSLSIQQTVKQFLLPEDNHRVLLLLGEGGSGKSMFCQKLAKELWQDYQKENPIPLLIKLLAIKDLNRIVEETLEVVGFNNSQIITLKQERQFIFILEGYNELFEFKNLYVSNRLEQWNAKALITCRSEFLYFTSDYEKYFMPFRQGKRQPLLLQQVYIEPLTTHQIEGYSEQQALTKISNKQENQAPDNKESEASTHPVLVTVNFLEDILGLKHWIKIPFFLKLVIEHLPGIVEQYRSKDAQKQPQLIQIALYDLFIDRWFTYQANFSTKDKQEIEKLKTKFWEYAKKVATQMQTQQTTVINYRLQAKVLLFHSAPSPEANVWASLFENNSEALRTRLSCPLRKTGPNEYGFIDDALVEHFRMREKYTLPKEMLDIFLKGKRKIESKDSKVSEPFLHLPNVIYLKSFTRKSDVVSLLADRVWHNEGFKNNLFKTIEASKKDEGFAIAAANAITVLNTAKVSFSGMDFSNIKILEADLSYGIFDETQFKEAKLIKTNLQTAWLRNANLQGANIYKVRFGQIPFLSLSFSVNDCCYSKDGRYLAVASNNIFIYSTSTYTRIRTLRGHAASVYSVDFSPDYKQLASGSFDNTIRLWEINSWNCLRILEGHMAVVEKVIFSQNGSRLMSGSRDGTLRLWETNSGHCAFNVLKENIALVNTTLTFSLDGSCLAFGNVDTPTVQLWKLKNDCYSNKNLEGHTDLIDTIAFSPDGRRLASCDGNGEMRLWEVESGSCLKILESHEDRVVKIIFSPNGKQLASGSFDNTIRLWEVDSGRCLRILQGHTGGVNTIAYSPNGRQLASGGIDNTVRLWEIEDNQPIRSLYNHTGAVSTIACSANGRQIASGSVDCTIRLWETQSGRYLRTLYGHTDAIRVVVFLPDGKLLASGSDDNTIRLWDMENGQCSQILQGNTNMVRTVAYSSNGKQLASGGGDNIIRLWNIENGQYSEILHGHTDLNMGPVLCNVVFSPDGKQLASGGRDNLIKLWDVEHSQCSQILRGHTGLVKTIAYSPDGKQLASGGDNTIRLWNIESGQCSQILYGHILRVETIVYSPDGKQLASGGDDNTFRLWDVESGQCLTVVQLLASINALCFQRTPQGLCLVTGTSDTAVRYWLIKENLKDKVKMQLLWSHPQVALDVNNANLEATQGMSLENVNLLKQGGGKGDPDTFQWLDIAVKRSDSNAQFELGTCYRDGRGVPKDLKIAAEWFTKAAEQDHVDAQFELGTCYRDGRGVPKDLRIAAEWFTKAAEQDHIDAQFELGTCYRDGKGIPKDLKIAAEWFTKAAEQDHVDAQFELGTCYRDGKGVSKDYKIAFEWYFRSAEQEHLEAQTAVKWFNKSAKNGNAEIQFALGMCYLDRKDVTYVPCDLRMAVEWLSKAAKQGYTNAQFELGTCYRDGRGVPKDLKIAAKWFTKAAERGHPDAQFNLGVCYLDGEGVLKNLKVAAKWFTKAAERGHADAQFNLGVCYLDGEGVLKNLKVAAEWFAKAAEQSHADAQYWLGIFCEYGLSIEQDSEQAFKWFTNAISKDKFLAAHYYLAFLYHEGHGVSKDHNKASEHFKKFFSQEEEATDILQSWEQRANGGDAITQFCMGFLCKNGLGNYPKDIKKAVVWFTKAAEQGNSNAQISLGLCYEDGEGVDQNLKIAMQCYTKAAKQGNKNGEVRIKMLEAKAGKTVKDKGMQLTSEDNLDNIKVESIFEQIPQINETSKEELIFCKLLWLWKTSVQDTSQKLVALTSIDPSLKYK